MVVYWYPRRGDRRLDLDRQIKKNVFLVKIQKVHFSRRTGRTRRTSALIPV
jgi:hypothetical protein